MDQQPHPYEQLDPQPLPQPAPRRRVPKVAVAVGLTAFLGLAGAGLAFATGSGSGTKPAALSSSAPTTPTSLAPGVTRPRPGPRGGPGMGFGPAVGGNVVHGEYTVQNGTTRQTITEQVGTVTKKSSSSITVKSADNYIAVYVVTPSTIVDSQSGGISTVAVSDTVRVQALVQGSTQTATNIVDTTKIGSSRKGFGFGRPGGPRGGKPGQAPIGPESTPA